MSFVKATRKKSKLRLAITGPSGSGKTYSALLLAKGLGGKIAVVDTENGSASLYSHLLEFDVMELREPYSPERYIAAIKSAETAGYNTLIIDSITPEWSGSGGILQLNQQIADAKFRGNTWSAWSETDPRHRLFIDAQQQCGMDLIVTMRSKIETAQEKDASGRTKVVQLGMKSEQRDNMVYEYTAVLDLTHEKHYANATKDRTGIFSGHDPQIISEKTGLMLRDWLNSGKEPEKPFDWLGWAKSFADEIKSADTSDDVIHLATGERKRLDELKVLHPEYHKRLVEVIAERETLLQKGTANV